MSCQGAREFKCLWQIQRPRFFPRNQFLALSIQEFFHKYFKLHVRLLKPGLDIFYTPEEMHFTTCFYR